MNTFLKNNVNNPTVVGTGLITLDVVLSEKTSSSAQIYAGGTCGNILATLSYLGWNSYPVARLSDDLAAQKVITDLERWNVKTNFLKLKPQANTPIIVQEIKQNSKGEFYHKFSWTCPQCGAWLPPFKPVLATAIKNIIEDFPKPQVFFFDRVSRGAIILAEKFAAQGAIIFFEPSGINDVKLFKEALHISHIVKYAEDRASQFKEIIADSNQLIEIETMSKRGLRFRSSIDSHKQKDWCVVPAFDTKVIDAAGAGDWCSSGIIHQIGRLGVDGLINSSKKLLFDALKLGQTMASWACGFESARGAMYQSSRKELNFFLDMTISNNKFANITSKTLSKVEKTIEYSCPSCANSVKIKNNFLSI